MHVYEITFHSVLHVKASDKKSATEIAYSVIQKTPNVVSPFPIEIKIIPPSESGSD
jgi:hypothetical protein